MSTAESSKVHRIVGSLQTRKHVLVTGATRGIGRAVVSRLLREGYDVSYTWLSSDEAASNIQMEASQFDGSVYPYQCDLTDTEQTCQLADVLSQKRPLHGIIHCATTTFTPPQASELTVQDWMAPLNINLVSPFILCSRLGPSLGADGAIVMVSSPNVAVGQEGMSTYAASKAALESFSRVLARELGPAGVRVNVVRPEPTLTEGFMAQAPDGGVINELCLATPLGRVANPDDVADAIYSLLGKDNRWVSGDILNVCGGFLAE
ncbi:SDR family NAD(P)-dependent oxidoreductase [Corynebacterium macginleyi]|uniref:SDR family NAD(P)-dependent oxidoreductase n=1 Tax=Corynebacterium macginleyi TaxID=38290 RepID=UPI00398B21DE